MTLASSQLVRIQICGPLAVECDGQRLEGRLAGRQGRLLFTYLAVNRHRYIPWDELAEALWREPDPAAVDARLNPLLSKLREVFGADAVGGRSTIRLCLRDAWIDLKPPPRLSTGPNPRSPSRTGRGRGDRRSPRLFVAERNFLPGEDAPWIDKIRHQLTELRLRALECYAAGSGAPPRPRSISSSRCARRLARQDQSARSRGRGTVPPGTCPGADRSSPREP